MRLLLGLLLAFTVLSAEEVKAPAKPPAVSDALQIAAYKTLANLNAVKAAIAQAQAQMPEAQRQFDTAQAALLGACGADFQMDQEVLKQEKFVCVAKEPQAKPKPDAK